MFDIFKQDIKVGDKVRLSLTTGKEPEGTVLEIGENFVLLETEDKTKSRFFDKVIGGWDILVKMNKVVAGALDVSLVKKNNGFFLTKIYL